MAELWDAYDKTWRKMKGLTLVRDEAISDGVYHLACVPQFDTMHPSMSLGANFNDCISVSFTLQCNDNVV